ncbi:thrombopoietin isoform X1 [Lagopus muta]|uniref:thrombopoietin isoform X1 n=1 Tax=Lagopus muta TaxID=64668 RepID=UPI00209CC6CA|nr:thrombopoietin isoform X1 [Lagopus muta]
MPMVLAETTHRRALGCCSGEESTCTAGGCRQGFPEMHVTARAAPGTNSPKEGLHREHSSAACLLPRLEQSLKPSTDACHFPPALLHCWEIPALPRIMSPGTGGRQDPSQPPKPPLVLLQSNSRHHQTRHSSCCCRRYLSWGSLRRVARCPWVSPSFPGLLLLTSFLLHIKEGHARPMGPVCDKRLIQKYIGEAKDMEKRMVRKQCLPKPSIRLGWQDRAGKNSRHLTTATLLPQQSECQALPTLSCPVVLPLVDFNMRQWKSKSEEIKWREILCNLVLLVGAVTEAQGQVSQECGANQLRQLYRHANSFLLLLQTFGWEEGPCCSPSSTEQTQVTEIFLTYRQLVQGKLRFFFHNLAKDSCD